MTQTCVLHGSTAKDRRTAAAAAAEALRAGQLVCFPTETVYGIAALASLPATMRRLRRLKDRPQRPFSVHLAGPDDAGQYVSELPSEAARLIRRAWPGPITLLVPTGGRLARADWDTPQLRRTLCSEGLIGLRCPDEPLCRAMLAAVDGPVVAPSANLAGAPSPRSAEEVLRDLDGRIDLLLDSGATRCGGDSTIVRVEPGKVQVVREGVVSARKVRRMVLRRYVFVCTGNTCRSPMAAGLAKKVLAERLGCRVGELSGRGVEVSSAGAFAAGGSRATEDAVAAAGQLGANLSRHRSRKLTSQLIRSADMVFCMTGSHVAQARSLAPQEAGKVRLLDPRRDIPDPIGAGRDVYVATARRIERALRKEWNEGLT